MINVPATWKLHSGAYFEELETCWETSFWIQKVVVCSTLVTLEDETKMLFFTFICTCRLLEMKNVRNYYLSFKTLENFVVVFLLSFYFKHKTLKSFKKLKLIKKKEGTTVLWGDQRIKNCKNEIVDCFILKKTIYHLFVNFNINSWSPLEKKLISYIVQHNSSKAFWLFQSHISILYYEFI